MIRMSLPQRWPRRSFSKRRLENAADASLAPPQLDPNAEYANIIPRPQRRPRRQPWIRFKKPLTMIKLDQRPLSAFRLQNWRNEFRVGGVGEGTSQSEQSSSLKEFAQQNRRAKRTW